MTIRVPKPKRRFLLAVSPAYGVRAMAQWWHSDERGWQYKTLSAKQIETLLTKADQAGWIK